MLGEDSGLAEFEQVMTLSFLDELYLPPNISDHIWNMTTPCLQATLSRKGRNQSTNIAKKIKLMVTPRTGINKRKQLMGEMRQKVHSSYLRPNPATTSSIDAAIVAHLAQLKSICAFARATEWMDEKLPQVQEVERALQFERDLKDKVKFLKPNHKKAIVDLKKEHDDSLATLKKEQNSVLHTLATNHSSGHQEDKGRGHGGL